MRQKVIQFSTAGNEAMRLFLRFHTFSKIYDPIVPASLIRLGCFFFELGTSTTLPPHTQHGVRESVASHVVFGPYIFTETFLLGTVVGTPAVRSPSMSRWNWNRKQKLKLISAKSRGHEDAFPTAHEPLSAFVPHAFEWDSGKVGGTSWIRRVLQSALSLARSLSLPCSVLFQGLAIKCLE